MRWHLNPFLKELILFQIDLKHKDQVNKTSNKVAVGIDLREFYPSVEWDILDVPAERHEKYYPCCAEPYPGTLAFDFSFVHSLINIFIFHSLQISSLT